MKKTTKLLILTTSFLALSAIPLILTSCKNEQTNKPKNNLQIKKDTDSNNKEKNTDSKQKNIENNKQNNQIENKNTQQNNQAENKKPQQNQEEIDFENIFQQLNLSYKNAQDVFFENVSSETNINSLLFNEIENVKLNITNWQKTENSLTISLTLTKNNQTSKTFTKEFLKSSFKQHTKYNFEDLNNFASSFTVKSTKNTEDALTAFNKLKENPSNLFSYINIGPELFDKYQIQADFKSANANNGQGYIKNISLVFTKQENQTKKTITVNGFKTAKKQTQTNLITKLELKDEIKALYPSFVGSMLVFNDNSASLLPQQKQGNDLFNWEYFTTHRGQGLFKNNLNLNFAILKNEFFEVNKQNKEKYDFKIEKVKANDQNGTLGIELKITNMDEHSNNYNKTQYEFFEFEGLRTLKLKDNKPEVFDFYIQQDDLKEALNKYKIIELANENKEKLNNLNQLNITNKIDKNKLQVVKNAIFNKLKLSTFNSSNTYQLTVTNNYLSNFNFKNNSSSIYPLYLTISNNIIKDIQFNLVKNSNNLVELKVNITLSVFGYVSNEYNDLIEQGTNNNEITWTTENYVNL
ncbi:hypothetical protein N8G13_01880 [Mycoplasma zalophi]|uniref:LppA-related lipoprotein n=1 Tax=Mycoplasma zalophi TaxID=191287 RepID=UPI0021C6394C|nr:hypothetical protein [Mycoplasma zalophi]MCU4117205.1 hypothetical protein [Mycoplasma zalophi]